MGDDASTQSLASLAEATHPRDDMAEVLAGRLASPVAAAVTLDAATELVMVMPTELARDPDVYQRLQRLAGEVEIEIFAVGQARHARAERRSEPGQ